MTEPRKWREQHENEYIIGHDPTGSEPRYDFDQMLADYAAQSQWIKITDDPNTLPQWDGIKNYVHVRVYGPKIEVMCSPADAYLWRQCDAIFDGEDFWAGDTKITELVTHWQNIPSSPK